MKIILLIFSIVLFASGSWAFPYVISDPYLLTDPGMTTESFPHYFYVTIDRSGNPEYPRTKIMLYNASVGPIFAFDIGIVSRISTYSMTIEACKLGDSMWGQTEVCGIPISFKFTKPSPVGVPQDPVNLRIVNTLP